jgi:urease accessory protein
MHDLALARLLRLASPALPLGAYGYSQGLESAIALGWVGNEADLGNWLDATLELSMGGFEAPVLVRLHRAWETDDVAAATHWNELLLAARETAELHAESVALGQSLCLLLQRTGELTADRMQPLQSMQPVSLHAALAFVAVRWEISARALVVSHLFAWLENQVQVAVKCSCIGHVSGQRLIARLTERLPQLAERALVLPDEDLSSSAPGLVIASSLHERAAARLFKS